MPFQPCVPGDNCDLGTCALIDPWTGQIGVSGGFTWACFSFSFFAGSLLTESSGIELTAGRDGLWRRGRALQALLAQRPLYPPPSDAAMRATINWNPNGTMASVVTTDNLGGANSGTCSFGYDDLARLASDSCASWGQTFSVDAFGNISTSGSSSFLATFNQASNRILTPSVQYDADGNITQDPSHTYTWDANGRPVAIDGHAANFDALGRMVEFYANGQWNQVAYGPAGRLGVEHNTVPADVAFPLPGGGEAVYDGSGSVAYFRHPDWQGSARVEVAWDGTVAYDRAYGAYGLVQGLPGATGRHWAGLADSVSPDVYDAELREFDAISGRWSSPDPAGMAAADLSNPQTLNRYAYAGNEPLMNTDPSGEISLADLVGSGGAGLAAVAGNPFVGLGIGIAWAISGLFGSSSPPVNTARHDQVHDYTGVDWNGALQGEVNGIPTGITVPDPTPFAWGVPGDNCDFGACGALALTGPPAGAGAATSARDAGSLFTLVANVWSIWRQTAEISRPTPQYAKPESMAACMTRELIQKFVGSRGAAGATLAVNLAALLVTTQGSGLLVPGPGWVYVAAALSYDTVAIAGSYLSCREGE